MILVPFNSARAFIALGSWLVLKVPNTFAVKGCYEWTVGVGVEKRGRIFSWTYFYSGHYVTPMGCWYLVKQDHQFLNKFPHTKRETDFLGLNFVVHQIICLSIRSPVSSRFLVHVHYKLFCTCLCSAEQNNKISLKNNNEWFIFMTESRLVSEWEKVLFGCQVAVSLVVRQFFSVLQVAALVLLCACVCVCVAGSRRYLL